MTKFSDMLPGEREVKEYLREFSFNMTKGAGGGRRYWVGAPKGLRHPKGGL